mmetsp:Transcript_2605/g.3709  ORF Transcript_2605/g.3709 Transcript_2605/m.3709 type:complete len:213 (-) Transcript_2605:1584-2222(-)
MLSKSPMSIRDDRRMRWSTSPIPFCRMGRILFEWTRPWLFIRTRPALMPISRTCSFSSDSPPIKAGRQSSSIGVKPWPRAGGRKVRTHNTPSRVLADGWFRSGRISSSMTLSIRVEPDARSTSVKPCAAPLLSAEVTSSDRKVSTSHGRSSGKASSPRPLVSDPKALAEILRTSGIGSSNINFKSGIKVGKYGTKSRGSLIMVQMLPVIKAP